MKSYILKQTNKNAKEIEFVSLQDAYEGLKKISSNALPPFDVFEANYEEDWFVKTYGAKVTAGKEIKAIDALRDVQLDYKETLHRLQSLKDRRKALMRVSLKENASVEDVLEMSEQSIFDLMGLDMPDIGEERWSEMEYIASIARGKNNRTRVLRDKKPKTTEERDWLNDYRKLQSWKKQRTQSKKNHNGDEWVGCDFTEDEFTALEEKVENGLM